MSLPDFAAGPDGFFRFGGTLADAASLLVAIEVAKQTGIQASLRDREIWAKLFNDVVRPEYGVPHTVEQIAELERALHKFVASTAKNYLQVRKMSDWQDLRRTDPFT